MAVLDRHQTGLRRARRQLLADVFKIALHLQNTDPRIGSNVGDSCSIRVFSSPPAQDLSRQPVLLDVTWTGEGPIVRTRDRSAESFDGTRLRFQGTSSSRSAAVDGGVSGEVAFDLGGASGSIADVSNGFWLWNRSTGAGFFALDGPSAALAESGLAVAAQVFVDRFRGSSANAFDEEFNGETGEFSFRDVSLGIGRTKSKGDRWFDFENVFVSSFTQRFDESAGSLTFTEWFGSGPLDTGSIDRKIASAEATATVTLSGITCTEFFEEPVIDCTELGETTVTVDVSWEGVGAISSSKSMFDSKTGSEHIRFSGRSTNRAAVANGVVIGDVVGWTLSDADGSLSRNADGSWFKG
ncbi:MAG: hypothetical protein OEW83_08025 [Acidimicrobiia bacterium]|nr:hypothetical protein [Acidimicrobiia bacterium]